MATHDDILQRLTKRKSVLQELIELDVQAVKDTLKAIKSENKNETIEKLVTLQDSLSEFKEEWRAVHSELQAAVPLEDMKELVLSEKLITQEISKTIRTIEIECNKEEISTSVQENKKANCAIPRLEIRPFNGKRSEYFAFKDTFAAIIDSNPQLSAVEKLIYLKTLMQNEASDILKNIEINKENYSLAWELLQNRFGNKNILIQKHINELVKMQKLTNNTDTYKLRKTIEEITINVRALENLGIKIKTNEMLFPIIHQIFPQEIVLLFDRGEGDKNTETLLKFLEEEIGRRELLSPTLNPDARSFIPQRNIQNNRRLVTPQRWKPRSPGVFGRPQWRQPTYSATVPPAAPIWPRPVRPPLQSTPAAPMYPTSRTIKCYGCDKVGHIKRDCPKSN